MTNHPIIFSAPMVLALLAGRKTMSRRLAWKYWESGEARGIYPSPWQRVKPGDRLWVRERLYRDHEDEGCWKYFADNKAVSSENLTAMIAWAHHKEGDSAPSIHMPRWASRIALVVTATKVERVNQISEVDARAEGWPHEKSPKTVAHHIYPSAWFQIIWNDLHGAASWSNNPEVVCLSFSAHQTNIDAMQEAA